MKEEILTKFTSGNGQILDMLNLDLKDGYVTRRKGWRNFTEMIKTVWELSETYKKYGAKGDVTIRLPIKGRNPLKDIVPPIKTPKRRAKK